MVSIQKTFQYLGDLKELPIYKLHLEIDWPEFSYSRKMVGIINSRRDSRNENKEYDEFGNQVVATPDPIGVNILLRDIDRYQKITQIQNLSDDEYYVDLPTEFVAGETINSQYSFLEYHKIQPSVAEFCNDIDEIQDFICKFKFKIIDEYGQVITSGDFEAIYGFKSDPSIDDPRYFIKSTKYFLEEIAKFREQNGTADKINVGNLQRTFTIVNRQIFLINKEAYESLKNEANQVIENKNFPHYLLLSLIESFVDISDNNSPRVNYNQDWEQFALTVLGKNGIPNSERIIALIKKNFDGLLDFPILVPEIKFIDIKGVFRILSNQDIERRDLNFYELTATYLPKGSSLKIIRHDWNQSNEDFSDNTVFSLTKSQKIAVNSVTENISIAVKGYDGSILWRKDFSPSDPELQELEIQIEHYRPDTLDASSGAGILSRSKRLRGKVIQFGNKYCLNDLTIVIQAKKNDGELWKIVGATTTDNSGNFSLDYPYGIYTEAQALVCLMPNSPANLGIDPNTTTNESISDDFIYLLLKENEISEIGKQKKDEECGCNSPGHLKRLPDQSDLIESDEYTQDIGGTCINLSTPNRTLREYRYSALVRTSDPDVANYVLKKEQQGSSIKYRLEGGTRKLQRGIVDLDNPIRWEDAPDAKSNLSLYQAVTVATGHILRFKSVFKADGYSLGDLVYSLPLAPGQKKQIVVFESSHLLRGAESQALSQGEQLSAELLSDRFITDRLSGGINENLRGSSAASTYGVSAGQGVGFTYGGMIGATLGIAGGYSGSSSSASQNSARYISQFFGEKLRQLLMQNAESYRELNASVVTTVTEGQDYGVTSEVVANHNHCHSLTLMYFEVLRHYAIFQELSHVEECVFVPLLMTDFTTENIYKWKDVLAKHLLPTPSDTYLQSHSWLRRKSRRHPLLKAFDANERIKTNWERVDFPAENETYADGIITQIQGRLTMNVNIPRPKTKYDRILSWPIGSMIVETEVFDPQATAKKAAKKSKVKWYDVLSGGSTYGFRNSSGLPIEFKTIEDEVFYTKKIFDAFMYLDANYESVPPAQCIRIMDFEPKTVVVKDKNDESQNVTTTGTDFFENDLISEKLWTAYAEILNFEDVFQMMNAYFKGRLIAEWDRIFYQELLPDIFAHIVDSIVISYGEVKTEKDSDGNKELIPSSGGFNLDFSTERKYTGGSRKINVNFNSQGEVGKKRSELPLYINLSSNLDDIEDIKNHIKLNIGRVSIDYETAYFQGSLYRGYVRDDLLDGTNLYIPLNSRDKINPRKEDKYIVNQLIEHLNSNIEHYNKVLWYNLDQNRRFMLLDGFNIEVFNSFGDSAGFRSLASVVKNELITVVGNSLVFPVADGYKVSKSYILEKSQENVQREISLFDYYKPFTPVPPYRVSVPTRGVFMEAIQGECDACELVKENSSQDWDKFRTEEPTPISPIITPTPTISDYKPQYKDFAPPLVNIQNAPNAPAPAAGLSQLTELLGKAGVFNDITGLEGNQQNVIDIYLSNQANAKAFAEMAKNLLMQQHNTQNSKDFIKRIEQARDNGAISEDDYKELTKQHLQQQIDGGESAKENAQLERERSKPSLTDAAIDAIDEGQSVQAERTVDGNRESITVQQKDGDSSHFVNIRYQIEPIEQPLLMSCWATAATIMMNWKNSTSSSIEEVLQEAGRNLKPSDEDYYLQIYNDDLGLEAHEKEQFTSSLEMISEPPANYILSQYVDWLQDYGPLWITTDDDSGSGFSPHARILFGIQGDIENNPNNVLFTFIDPADSTEVSETFNDFIKYYEQMVTDIPSNSSLFIQIVRFEDRAILSEGKATQRIRVRNEFLDNDKQIGNFVVNISSENETFSRDFSFSGNGYHNIDISDFEDGLYLMSVTPENTLEPPINWPSLGASISGTKPPDRIWQKIETEIEIKNHRIVSSLDNKSISINGRNLNVKLRPIWLESPKQKSRSSGTVPTLIVVHHTGQTRPLPLEFVQKAGRDVSAHYVIPRDGKIIKLVHESKVAYHTGASEWASQKSVNEFSVGIEVVHKDGSYTNAQYESLINLLSQILLAYPSIDSHKIVGHSDVAVSKTGVRMLGRKLGDPGLEFNWPLLEGSGLGLVPANESDVFDEPIETSGIYGGLFKDDLTVSLPIPIGERPENYKDIIREVNKDLKRVGYLVSSDPEAYSEVTKAAVQVFKTHFFTGERRREGKYTVRFDFETAKMLKRVIFSLPS